MIQPLCTYHRRMFMLLAIALPSVLVFGLRARQTIFISALPEQDSDFKVISEQNGDWKNYSIQIRLLSKSSDPNTFVQLLPQKEIVAPDVLVYWAGNRPQANTLPRSSQLLGTLNSEAHYPLPANRPAKGALILYSLADRSILDVTSIGVQP